MDNKQWQKLLHKNELNEAKKTPRKVYYDLSDAIHALADFGNSSYDKATYAKEINPLVKNLMATLTKFEKHLDKKYDKKWD